MNRPIIFVLTVVTATFAGCDSAPPVQTVDWYKQRDAERISMIGKCNDSPGDLAASPNCINAQQADKETASARRGYVTPDAVDFDEGG